MVRAGDLALAGSRRALAQSCADPKQGIEVAGLEGLFLYFGCCEVSGPTVDREQERGQPENSPVDTS